MKSHPALTDQVQALMSHYSVPGVAVGILCDGEEILAGYGVTNVTHPLPVDVAGDRLLFVEGPAKGGRLEVLRDPPLRIAWLRVGGRIHRRVERGSR